MSKLHFKIKTNSVHSGNKARDTRLYENFFKLMKNGEEIKGYGISYDKAKNQSIIEVEMNGEKTPIVFKSMIKKDGGFSLTGKIDIIKDYKMLTSFESLSDLCKALHTGKDGVSKTWSEVGIFISGHINKSCK